MLGKLLKYDLKSSFKFWWIIAVAFVLMSVFGGVCSFLVGIDPEAAFGWEFQIPYMIKFLSRMGIILFYAVVTLFNLAATVLIFIRLYRNFFTDEGYLTFTLPVKRSTLLNSKIISGMIVVTLTEIVTGIGFAFVTACDLTAKTLNGDDYKDYLPEISLANDFIGIIQFVIVVIEILTINLFALYIHNLFVYWCGTFAATITKKARFITSIGIYYVASNVVSFILQILLCFGIGSIANWLVGFSSEGASWMMILLLFCFILLCWIVSILLYINEYWMLDKKLNMA